MEQCDTTVEYCDKKWGACDITVDHSDTREKQWDTIVEHFDTTGSTVTPQWSTVTP